MCPALREWEQTREEMDRVPARIDLELLVCLYRGMPKLNPVMLRLQEKIQSGEVLLSSIPPAGGKGGKNGTPKRAGLAAELAVRARGLFL